MYPSEASADGKQRWYSSDAVFLASDAETVHQPGQLVEALLVQHLYAYTVSNIEPSVRRTH